MIRAILRYIQNSLVLSAVLLVVLALQRMQSFDFHKVEDHPVIQGDSSGDPFGWQGSIVNRGVFGREVSIGLFRFALPRLDRFDPSPSSFEILRPPAASRPKTSLRRRKANTVSFLIQILECSSQSLEEASVLRQSIAAVAQQGSYELHAVVHSNSTDACSSAIKNLGFRSIDIDSIKIPKTTAIEKGLNCSQDAAKVAFYATNQIRSDIVIKTPLPSIILSKDPFEFGEDAAAFDASKDVDAELPIILSTGRSDDDPVGAIVRSCVNSTQSEMDLYSPWMVPGLDFKIDNRHELKLGHFSGCPLEKACNVDDNATTNSCLFLQRKWCEFRKEVKRENLTFSIDRSSVA